MAATAKKKAVTPKSLDQEVNGERYRTALSYLLAYDDSKKLFLFRALNSDYFKQDDKKGKIIALTDDEAEELYKKLPVKVEASLVAAFPRRHGGVGLATPTCHDEDE